MRGIIAVIAAAAALVGAPALAADDTFITVDDAKALVGKPGVQFVFADSEKEFANGHIPGSAPAYAHDLHYLDDVRKCKGLPMCEPTAFDFIGKLGIDAATDVIVYDNGMGPNASGDWFFLKLYGVQKVRILDGGFATWKAKGGAVEKEHKAIAAKAFKGAVQWDMIASKDEVLKATQDKSKYLILDARHNLDEYTGKSLLPALASAGKEETVARGGSIPTAVFSPWTKYAGNKKGDADLPVLKSEADLKKQVEKLKKHGYAPDKEIITYCHVGLGRGSFQYLALKKAGHQNVKVYVGSWDEWGNTPELPLGTQTAAAGD